MRFAFATSFHFQFGATRYITRLNRTSEFKVIAVCICYELPFSISTVSIYYWTQSDILVKSYFGFHLLGASVFNFECLDILRDSIGNPNKRLLSFEFATSFHFEFGASRYITGLNILRDSIGHPSKKLLPFKFSTSFHFQFRASRYITGLNRTSE